MIRSLISFVSKLSGREKIIFYATAVVVSLVLMDKLVLGPILSEINSLDGRIRNQKTSALRALRILGRRDELEEKINIYEPYFRKPLSDDRAIRALRENINELAAESSVSVNEMKALKMELETRLKRYFVRIRCEARMEQVVEFIYKIESSDEILKIEKFYIEPKKKRSSTVRCDMSISQTIIL